MLLLGSGEEPQHYTYHSSVSVTSPAECGAAAGPGRPTGGLKEVQKCEYCDGDNRTTDCSCRPCAGSHMFPDPFPIAM